MDEKVNNCGSGNTETPADAVEKSGNKFLDLLPKIMPYLACAVAALSLIFTFLIGYSQNGSAGYFYKYFGKAYDNVKIFESLGAVNGKAVKTTAVLGTVFSVFGLLAVLVFAGFTVYRAIRLFVFKHSVSVEKFAILTYFAYVAFAAIIYAFNCASSVSYNAATITGLTLSTVAAGCLVACKVLVNLNKFKNKRAITNAVYSVICIAVLAVIAGLAVSPVANIKYGFTDGTSVVKYGFLSLITAGAGAGFGEGEDIASLTSSSGVGAVVAAALLVLCIYAVFKLLCSVFENKKTDSVIFIIGLVASVLVLFFAALGGSYLTDVLSADAIKAEIPEIKSAVPVPIALVCLCVVMLVLSVARPAIVDAIAKEKKEEIEHVSDGEVLLEVKNLTKHFVVGTDFFGRPTKFLKAVDGVSFSVKKGKTLGIVGESGCGKTTMGRTLLRLYDVTAGEVWFKGRKVSDLKNREFDKLRPDMQMIFQDPYASLSPRLTVGEIIGEAAKQHKIVKKSEYHDYVLKIMEMCGLQPHYYERYPHEFSGGQRQRICIARALALKPDLVVCDEPVSALDVSIQAQIINMLIELRKTLGLTYVFISHDLSVVKHISDEIGVMYLGSMVEYGSKDAIFNNTLHPYTKALFSAVPVPDPHVKMNRIILKGDIPSPVNPPKGCKFHTRCENCMDICKRIAPAYKEIEEGHFCACHLYNTEEETRLLEEQAEEEAKAAAETDNKKEKFRFFERFKKKAKVSVDSDGAEKEAEVNDVPKE